jgi:hypothetical protein
MPLKMPTENAMVLNAATARLPPDSGTVTIKRDCATTGG